MGWLKLKQGQPVRVLGNEDMRARGIVLLDAVVIQSYTVGNRVMANVQAIMRNRTKVSFAVLAHSDVILTVNTAAEDMKPAEPVPAPPGVDVEPIGHRHEGVVFSNSVHVAKHRAED